MKPVICWQTEQLHKVMDTDALHVQRHLFLATHHPIRMYKQTAGTKVQSRGTPYDESEFLRDFMMNQGQIFVPILGESGTGKSHLVRWLHARIEKKGRKVLLVPRLTNLKEILLMMLDGMEDPVFEEYRQRVRHSVGNVTSSQAREMLHNNITLAIGPNGNHAVDRLDDYDLHLMRNLPHLFRDPALIPEWFKEGGVIDQLTENIVGGNGGRLNERREFAVSDLPLNLAFINRASDNAKEIYADLIADYDLQVRAVEWINRNLDSAIAAMLNLSNTDLIQLMNQIRVELARKDIELVLLIEDFTVLQGIDHQLLDALIYKSSDEGAQDKLCNMRVALGCTTGYFQRFEDTVLTRTDFRVTLDVNEELVPREEVVRFVSKYLNAVRLPEQDIMEWANKKEADQPLPTACAECKFAESCHEAFGHVDGVGLYPFNRIAIHTMYARGTKEDNFNPRLMISKVLRYILENGTQSILEGTFPSPALFGHFGGRALKRLSTMVQNDLDRRDPIHRDRRDTLIELWTEEYDVVDVHPFIHDAFSLPPLHVRTVESEEVRLDQGRGKSGEKVTEQQTWITEQSVNSSSSRDQVAAGIPTGESEAKAPSSVEQWIQVLDQWANDGGLSQTQTQYMRDILFAALNDYINWDFERLHLKWFQDNGLWSKKSINFEGQSTQHFMSPINLMLPYGDGERKNTALALQGIVYFNHYKHWEFRKGAVYLRFVARYLERWRVALLAQFRAIPLINGAWDPLSSVSEVLSLTAVMGGGVDVITPESITMALFEPLQSSNDNRTSEWMKLYDLLLLHRNEIRDMALSRLAIMKGESGSRIRMVDAAQIYTQVVDLDLDHLSPSPDEIVNPFGKLVRCSEQLTKQATNAVEAEQHEKAEWESRLSATLGQEIDSKVASKLIKEAISCAMSAAVLRGDPQKIQVAATVLERGGVAKSVRLLCANKEKQGLELMAGLARLPVKQIANVMGSIELLNSFLDQSTAKVEHDLAQLQGDDAMQELQATKSEIEQQLESIMKGFAYLSKGEEDFVNGKSDDLH